MRLIDADALKADVLEWEDCYNGFSDTYDKARIIDAIDEQPTINAELIRRGRWIDTGEIWTDMYTADEDPIYKCSVCNVEVIGGGMAYCSNCGARMEDRDEVD